MDFFSEFRDIFKNNHFAQQKSSEQAFKKSEKIRIFFLLFYSNNTTNYTQSIEKKSNFCWIFENFELHCQNVGSSQRLENFFHGFLMSPHNFLRSSLQLSKKIKRRPTLVITPPPLVKILDVELYSKNSNFLEFEEHASW